MRRVARGIALTYALAALLAPGLHDHGRGGCLPAASGGACDDQGPGLAHAPDTPASSPHACAACAVQTEHAPDPSPPLTAAAEMVDVAPLPADPSAFPEPTRLSPSRAPPRA